MSFPFPPPGFNLIPASGFESRTGLGFVVSGQPLNQAGANTRSGNVGAMRFGHRGVQQVQHLQPQMPPFGRAPGCTPVTMPMRPYSPSCPIGPFRFYPPGFEGGHPNGCGPQHPFQWPEKDSNFFIRAQVGMTSVPCGNYSQPRPANIGWQPELGHYSQTAASASKDIGNRFFINHTDGHAASHRVAETSGYRFPAANAAVRRYCTGDLFTPIGSSEKVSNLTGASKSLNASSQGTTSVSELDNFELTDEFPEDHARTKINSKKKRKKKKKSGEDIDWSFFDRLKDPDKQHFNSASASSFYCYRKGTNGPFRGVQVVDRMPKKLDSPASQQDGASLGDYLWDSVTSELSEEREASIERDELTLIPFKKGQEKESFFSFLVVAKSVKNGSSLNDHHNFLGRMESSSLPEYFKAFFRQFCDEQIMRTSPTNDEIKTFHSFPIGFIRMVIEQAMQSKDLSRAIQDFKPGSRK
ncbi:hypothetical protein [Endozoicomonas elysicola]|nr:hypothetical protein [Endozoicomonas elysicola]